MVGSAESNSAILAGHGSVRRGSACLSRTQARRGRLSSEPETETPRSLDVPDVLSTGSPWGQSPEPCPRTLPSPGMPSNREAGPAQAHCMEATADSAPRLRALRKGHIKRVLQPLWDEVRISNRKRFTKPKQESK